MVFGELIKDIVIGEVTSKLRPDLEVLAPAVLGEGLDVQPHGHLVKVDAADPGGGSAVILEPFRAAVEPEHVTDLIARVAGDAPPLGGFAVNGCIVFPAKIRI